MSYDTVCMLPYVREARNIAFKGQSSEMFRVLVKYGLIGPAKKETADGLKTFQRLQ
jgi:hypothetical protein